MEQDFVELLEKLEADITALTDDELTEARTKLAALGSEIKAAVKADMPTDKKALDKQVEDADSLTTAVKNIDAELSARATAATEAAEKIETAFAAFDDDVVEEPAEPVVEEEPTVEEPVVAAAPLVSAIAAKAPKNVPTPDPVSEQPKVVIASAVGRNDMGNPFGDAGALAEAMSNAARKGPMNGSQTVARMDLGHPIVASDDGLENWKMFQDIQRGVAHARVEGQALVAAGFCAPAEPRYDFFQQGSRDGIIDLPVVTARRGRITYPEIRDVRGLQVEQGVAWETTSTMDEDAVEKPCLTIACVDGETFDVKGYSTCLLYSNFDSQFWPERVTYVSGQAMIAHDHEVNLALIAAIVADGRTRTVVDAHAGGGTLLQLSNSLAEVGTFIRGRFRLPIDSVLEAAIPSYVLDALIADIVARASTVTYGNARAEIEAIFARMRINVQWVYDWQEMDHPNWDADYDYLIWPAGSIVQLSGGVLDLGVTRDSTLNVANDFQIFSETFDGHAIIGSGVYVVTAVNLCPTGGTGQAEAVTCVDGS